MLILPIVIYVLIGGRRWWSILASIVLFAWWKSPWSQDVIDLVNGELGMNWGRVVDYTDLWAFIMLPLAWQMMQRTTQAKTALHPTVKWAPVALFVLMSFGWSDDDDLPPNDWQTTDCCAFESSIYGSDYPHPLAITGAFSPNGDGQNDLFQVHFDERVAQVDSFSVYRLRGYELVHFVQQVEHPRFITWDGRVEGVALNERFTYQMKATTDANTSHWIYGYVCSITCDVDIEAPPFESAMQHCGWPVQYVQDSFRFDLTIDPGEGFDCL